jgi:Tfp pilus assembly protein PilN
MMRFNLLPHRTLSRRRCLHRLVGVMLAAALSGCVFTAIAWHMIDRQREDQQARNQQLQQDHRQLNAEIAQAHKLQLETALLLARAAYIEKLADQRSRTTHLLAILAAQLPRGAYLKKMSQQATAFTLDGYADSSQDVSVLLQNFNNTGITSARLLETRAGAPGRPLLFSIILTPADTDTVSDTDSNIDADIDVGIQAT